MDVVESDDKIQFYDFDTEKKAEAEQQIAEDTQEVKEFFKNKLEKDAAKHWDIFYKQNKTNFFKDRHYLLKELPELEQHATENEVTRLLDAGCGVGNALFPLSESLPTLETDAFDFSKNAVSFVQAHEAFDSNRMKAETVDLVNDDIPFDEGTHDFAVLIFVLSAISPDHFAACAKKMYDQLAPGGLLFFRDYGKFDLAQLRFAARKKVKLGENFYVRSDNTRSYFFEETELNSVFEEAGFVTEKSETLYRLVENKKQDKQMHRVWIQCKYRKPSE